MRHERISIHAGNSDDKYSPHPKWKDECDKDLDSSPFSEKEEDAAKELHELNELIEGFLDKAPSDANAEIHVNKTEDGFDATIDVYSSQRAFGPFKHVGETFREVVEKLFEEMKEEVDQWKSQRRLNVGDGL